MRTIRDVGGIDFEYHSIWRQFSLSAHNPHSAILRQFNVIWVLLPDGSVDIAIEPRESTSGGITST